MSSSTEQQFRVGQIMYLVYDLNCRANVVECKITGINKTNTMISIVLYNGVCHYYNIADYGRLIFDNPIDAWGKVRELPPISSIVYQTNGNKIFRKKLECIVGKQLKEGFDLKFCFNRGEASIKELNETIFIDRADAEKW